MEGPLRRVFLCPASTASRARPAPAFPTVLVTGEATALRPEPQSCCPRLLLSAESRRPVSTPERNSGCRLAVKRFALGFAGRPVGDGSVGHPLGGSEVGPGARRGWNDHGDVLL